MKNISKIKGDLINGVYTKFYYAGQTLCYQIVVNYGKGKILYKDFKRYKNYQNYHRQLIGALNSNKEITADFVMLDNNERQVAS